ncbi:response regulator transcription factor [Pedobacter deserti]|uniref:response regulator transcription factor n=1 Tax=Pedobacter deserti TaxID=2817382 RepID=UPI00210D450F|nr:DNA-binding response regulator [Pedobacter sp. SYSU D00382]
MMNATILLIDDNPEILEFIEDSIAAHYQVLKTQQPMLVEDILRGNPVDLIISDVMMPDLDGFELCRQLKSSMAWCHIPLILLTAKNTLTSRIEGLETGADAYIEKPFSPRHLLAQIKNLLENRDTIRNYFASSPLSHLKSTAGNNADEQFLARLNDAITSNLDNPGFDIQSLADLLCISRPTLYRKVRSASNLTLTEIITLARLKKAAALLSEGTYRISEVANITGFSSPNHFSRSFFRAFKMSPSTFIKNLE